MYSEKFSANKKGDSFQNDCKITKIKFTFIADLNQMCMRLTTIIMAGSGRVVFSARKCLILACLTGLCAVMALFPEFHDNTKVTEPRISSFETSSVQTCIHKCQLHALCNVVSARQISGKVECIFSNVCYETLQKRLQKSNGWQTYVILEKLYHLNMVRNFFYF